MTDIGEVKWVKLEPELVDIKEEPTNESTRREPTNEFHEPPVEIKQEPEVNFPCNGDSGQMTCWSPNSVKEEWIDYVPVEELDVDTSNVDPLGFCPDNQKHFEASECSKLTEEFLEMSRVSEKNKPHLYDVCGSGFARKRDLREHMRTHTGEKPCVCDVCGKGFSRISNLKNHMRTHTGEKPYVCDVCGKGFIDSSQRKIHMRSHTGEKPYVCDICDKGFTSSSHLTVHVRTHTGERPYVCDVCGKGFTTRTLQKRHKRIHLGETPHVCAICGKWFSDSPTLKNHKSVHRAPEGGISGYSNISEEEGLTQACSSAQKQSLQFDKVQVVNTREKFLEILDAVNTAPVRRVKHMLKQGYHELFAAGNYRAASRAIIDYVHQKAAKANSMVCPKFTFLDLTAIAQVLADVFNTEPDLWFYTKPSSKLSASRESKLGERTTSAGGYLWNRVQFIQRRWRDLNPSYKQAQEKIRRKAGEKKRQSIESRSSIPGRVRQKRVERTKEDQMEDVKSGINHKFEVPEISPHAQRSTSQYSL